MISARSSGGDLLAGIGLRDIIVLAVDAAQVAPAEKNGAAPASPHQRPLLAEMRAEGDDAGAVGGPANGPWLSGAVGFALVRTHHAVPKPETGLLGAASELA